MTHLVPNHINFQVHKLVKGGPAERSRKISLGDRIVGIDGTSIAPLTEKRVRELLLGPPGSQVSIVQGAHFNAVREKTDFEIVLELLTFCVFTRALVF
jgi:C-terminal processing protease CtpA/Prc